MYATGSKSIRIAIIGAITAGLLQVAHALGLGPITVNSHIGEPLRAVIEVTGLDGNPKNNTVVSVADEGAYRSRGIDKLPSHDQLKLSLRSSVSGHYIDISTPNMMREPFITFILSVKHDGKETLREYTVFLDPATDSLSIPAVPSPSNISSVEEIPDTSSQIKLLVDQPAAATSAGWQGKASKPVASVTDHRQTQNWQGRSYGPVKKGETLFSIAEKVRPSADFPVQAIMQQIYQANPRAFNSSQLGSLMAGYQLSIPEFTKKLVTQPTEAPKPASPAAESVRPSTPSKLKQTAATNSVPAQSQEIEEISEESTQNSALRNDNTVNESMPIDVAENGDVEDFVPDDEQRNAEQVLQSADAEATGIAEQSLQTDVGIALGSQESDKLASTDDTAEDHDNTVTVNSQQSPGSDTLETKDLTPSEADSDSSNPDLVVEKHPVEEQEPQSFLYTTYAFLPTWQWLAIGGGLLALIALLLFKQRKKHTIDEFDTLDEAEMDAVLAKINALENDDNLENLGENSFLTENVDHDDFAESKESEQPNWDGDIVFDELEDFESNRGEEKEEQIASIGMDQDHMPAVENEDDDFFLAGDEEQVKVENAESSEIDDFDLDFGELEDSQVTASEVDSLPEQDDLDFFISEDVVDKEPSVSATESSLTSDDEGYANKESGSWLDEEPDLDELFINDGDLKADHVMIGDEIATEQTLGAEEPVVNEVQNAPEATSDQLTSVNPEEMEINLDLAVSFIATGHGERAVIWLEEVLEVGTDEQKARAKELMDKVRGA